MRIKTFELIILFAMSAMVIVDGIVLAGLDRMRAGEAGGYEILLGTILAGMTALYWSKDVTSEWPPSEGIRYVAIAFGVLVIYAFALPYLGYMLSTFLVTIAYMRGLSDYRWLPTVGFALAFSVGTTWLWARLVIVVPQGILPWPLL